MNSGIYKISFEGTDYVYVGSSYNVKRRLTGHKRELVSGTHGNQYLQRVYNKHSGVLHCDVIEECDVKDLLAREQYWYTILRGKVKLLNLRSPNRYETTAKMRENMSKVKRGRRNSFYGKHHTKETRQKLSKANKGKPLSAEHRQKLSKAGTGRFPSDETRRRLSAAQRRRGPLPPESIQKMAESLRVRWKNLSEDERQKVLDDLKRGRENRVCTKDTRHKMSEAMSGENNPNYGKHHTEERKRKVSEKLKGRKHTEIHNKRKSEAMKKRWETLSEEERQAIMIPLQRGRRNRNKPKVERDTRNV